MSYSQNSLKEGYIRDCKGSSIGVKGDVEGDTMSLGSPSTL